MKKKLRYPLSALSGAVCGALGVFLSSVFIRNMGCAAGFVMRLIKLDADIANQVASVLSQLKTARLSSPYLIVALVSACLFMLFAKPGRNRRRVVRKAAGWLGFLILSFFVSLIFTHVNDILFLDMIKLLISIVPNL